MRMVSFSPVPISSVTTGLERYWRKVTRAGGASSGPPSAKGSAELPLLGFSPAPAAAVAALLSPAGPEAEALSAPPLSAISTSADALAGGCGGGASPIDDSRKLSDILTFCSAAGRIGRPGEDARARRGCK